MDEHTDKILIPVNQRYYEDILVNSYVPDEIRNDGVCLIMGILFALYGNNPYEFKYLMLRRNGNRIFDEPLIYKEQKKLVLKEICQDINRFMDGDLGSVYVEMTEKKTGVPVGASFWNADSNNRSFSVAYRINGDLDTKRLTKFINQVYAALLNNFENLVDKLELPEAPIYHGGVKWEKH